MRSEKLRTPLPSCCAGVSFAVLLGVNLHCSGSTPRVGHLPRVIVPLEEPAPSPQSAPAKTEDSKSDGKEAVRLVPNADLPDPPATRSDRQVEYEFRFERGQLAVVGQRDRLESQPVLTPRRMGRFAVELFVGPELVERVRFDFPLLGDESATTLEKGLRTQATVLVPLLSRATRARLLDRKTRRELTLEWPPVAATPNAAP